MPDLGASAIIGIISLLAGGGEFAASELNKPGTPKPPTAAQLATQNQLNPTQLANAVRAAKGDTQAATSGGVSPDYLSQLIQSQYGASAGNPGVIGQQASQQWSGGSFGSPVSTGPGAGGLPFGNATSGGQSGTGLATPTGSSGFNISEWLQQMQQQGATA